MAGTAGMSRSMVYKLHFWPPYKHAGHYSGEAREFAISEGRFGV